MRKITYTYDVSGKKTLDYIVNEVKKYRQENKYKKIRVLDVGCGCGQISYILSRFKNIEIDAFDLDPESLKSAKELCKGRGNIRFYENSVENYDYKENYDIVIMTQILDHIPDPELTVSVVSKHMVLGGIVICGISNGQGLFEKNKPRFKNLRKINFPNSKRMKLLNASPYTLNNHSPHLHHFKYNDILKIFDKSDLEEKKYSKMTFVLPAFPISILFYYTPMAVGSFLETLDHCLAFVLPKRFSSNWYITFKKI